MIENSYAPNDAPISQNNNDRYTLEIQLTGYVQSSTGQDMAQGIITLRAPDGTEHDYEFNSGGYGKYDESWIPGLDRTDCDLVHYDLDWENMAVEVRNMPSGFTGPDGTGSWIALVSPRHFTDRGASPLGGSSSGSFGIHTDGNAPGSLGCVALSDADAESLFGLLKNIPEEQRPLRVNVLPPQENFSPASVDPEIFPGINMQAIGAIKQAACESYLRTEFDRLASFAPVKQGVQDEFTMTANRSASLLMLDQSSDINQQTMLGIWDLNSNKGHPRDLSQGQSNWGMTETQFANALLHHGPEIEEHVRAQLSESDIQNEANDIRAFTVALRNYMAETTGMDISVALDSPEADAHFAGLEVPSDMFSDPTKIAFLEQQDSYRRFNDRTTNLAQKSIVSRLVESDGVTSENDFADRFALLRRLPLAEQSALTTELLATAETIGIDPALSENAGHLYAAYRHGDLEGTSENAERYQREVDLNSSVGMGQALPFVTDALIDDVQASMSENPQANPYDRIQAAFIDAGVYSSMDQIREHMSTPLVAMPLQPLSMFDGNGLDHLPDLSIDVPSSDPIESAEIKQPNFQL